MKTSMKFDPIFYVVALMLYFILHFFMLIGACCLIRVSYFSVHRFVLSSFFKDLL